MGAGAEGPQAYRAVAESADTEARLERLLRIGDLLEQTARRLGPALDLTHTLRTVLRAMRETVDFRGGSVCLVEGTRVHIAAADPSPSPEVMASSLPVGSGLVGRVVATGETMWSHDLLVDDRVDPEQRSLGSNATMRSYLAVPLVVVGEVIGALQIDSEEPRAFTDDDRRLLQWLAVQVAGAIESARRYEQIALLERMRSNLVDQVSHELRTPLAIIQGFLHVLRDPSATLDHDERQQFLDRVGLATDRLAAMVEELIRFARLERGVLRPSPAATELADLLRDVATEATDPGRVEVDCEAGITVHIDPALLSEALGLLVDNGLKYGDQVVLRGAEGRIEVLDDGPGLPDDVAAVALEPFTRGHLGIPGMGVGLPIARSIIDVSGGSLRLEARPEGGTAAVIELRPQAAAAKRLGNVQ